MARIIRKAGHGMRALWLKLLAFLAGLFGVANLASCPIVALYMPPPGATVSGRVVKAGSEEPVRGIKASLINGGDSPLRTMDTGADGCFYLSAYGLDQSEEIILELIDLGPDYGSFTGSHIDLKALNDFDPDGDNELGDIELNEVEPGSGE
jgi:hypothetical protein